MTRRFYLISFFIFFFIFQVVGQSYFHINGNNIHYERKGSGSPMVIFVHGYAGALSSFDSVFNKTSAFTTAVRYSRAGLGKSSYTNKRKDFDTIVRELEMLVDSLQIKKPFVLAANSFGGLIIRNYAKKHPENIAGLLFIDATFEDYFVQLTKLKANAKLLELMEHESNKIKYPSKGMDDEFQSMWRVWHSPDKWQQWFEPLPAVPTVVLTSMKITDSLLRNSTEAMQLRYTAHSRWVKNKPFSMHIAVTNGGHLLQRDTPQLIIEAIQMLNKAIRKEL